MSEIMMRPCGGSWAYCDGDCDVCSYAVYLISNGTVTTKTNADHIRSMTDEGLAKFLLENSVCFGDGAFPYHPCPQDQDCEKCGIDWLKQPYKEET